MSEQKTYTITRTKAVMPGVETVTLALGGRPLHFKQGASAEAKTDRLTAAQLRADGYEVKAVTKKKKSSKKASEADKE